MNKILQKRIEEAARHYLLHEHKSPLNEILHQCDLKTEMQYHEDIEQAYIEGATFALQNQWISVDEALPEYNEIVLVHINGESGVGEMFSERTEQPFLVMIDENNFKIDSENDHITHWMPIPKV